VTNCASPSCPRGCASERSSIRAGCGATRPAGTRGSSPRACASSAASICGCATASCAARRRRPGPSWRRGLGAAGMPRPRPSRWAPHPPPCSNSNLLLSTTIRSTNGAVSAPPSRAASGPDGSPCCWRGRASARWSRPRCGSRACRGAPSATTNCSPSCWGRVQWSVAPPRWRRRWPECAPSSTSPS